MMKVFQWLCWGWRGIWEMTMGRRAWCFRRRGLGWRRRWGVIGIVSVVLWRGSCVPRFGRILSRLLWRRRRSRVAGRSRHLVWLCNLWSGINDIVNIRSELYGLRERWVDGLRMGEPNHNWAFSDKFSHDPDNRPRISPTTTSPTHHSKVHPVNKLTTRMFALSTRIVSDMVKCGRVWGDPGSVITQSPPQVSSNHCVLEEAYIRHFTGHHRMN